jgi:hypothetical protein
MILERGVNVDYKNINRRVQSYMPELNKVSISLWKGYLNEALELIPERAYL